MTPYLKYYILHLALLISIACYADPPDWTVNPADYQFNMIGTIRVVTLNNTYLNADSTMVRALVDGETRGVVPIDDIIFIGEQAYLPMTIYSNEQEGELLSFEVYANDTDSIYKPIETAIFDRFETLGSPPSPFLLTIGICKNILVLTAADVPFAATYRAGQLIQIIGTIPSVPDSLTLDAATVSISDELMVEAGQHLTVKGDGCTEQQ